MKTLKKMLCVILSVIMAFGCLSMTGSAVGTVGQFSYTLKYKSERSDTFNADMVLDELDAMLEQANIIQVIDLEVIEMTVDLRSVNALCNTLDEFRDLFYKPLIFVTAKLYLGNIGDLNFKTWKTGMKRGSQDITILKELIEFLEANKDIIAKFCDATIDLGVLENWVDVKSLLGDDGIEGLLKEMLIDLVYDGDDVSANYVKYRDNIDSFIFGDLLSSLADSYLPGFEMDVNTKVKDLVNLASALIFNGYVLDLIKWIDVDLASQESDDLKALAAYVNLNGSTYDFSDVKLDGKTDLLSQVNDVAGLIFKQVIPGYTWAKGDWTKINDNIEGALKYLGKQSGLIPDADSLSFDEIVMQVIAIILRNVDIGSYADGLTQCETLEDMVAALLMNVAKENELAVTYKGDESYLVVLGDLLAWVMYDKFDITDYNGKAYREGGGKDVFEVANYILNYFLFDEGAATVLGLNTTKTETFFKKVDKLADYFGKSKSTGIDFDSEKFLIGKNGEEGILDAIFDLDIEKLLSMTAVKAINKAGDVSAVEFIYRSIQYALNNWAGDDLLPEYTKNPFGNALSEESISNMIAILLGVLNSKKNSIIPLALSTAALIMDNEEITVDITHAVVSDFEATGKNATPTATVKIGDKVLTQGVDFDVISENKELGAATAKIKGIGIYSGSFEVPFNIVLSRVGDVTVTQATTVIKLKWDEVAYADKYNVYLSNGSEDVLLQTVTKPVVYIRDLTPGTKYVFTIESESDVAGKSAKTQVKTVTKPTAVDSTKVKTTSTDTTVTLTWTAANGATAYRVDRYTGGTWKKVDTTSKTTLTVKGLKSYTKYVFRVISYTRDHNKKAVYGSASSNISARTTVSPVTPKVSSTTSKSIKIAWDKLSGASGYHVLFYTGGKWKTITTTSNSYVASNLKPNTKYYFKVRAYVKDGKTTVTGPLTSITAYTNLSIPSSVKVKTTASSATLTWSKVSGADGYQVWQYVGGKWVRKTNVTTNKATIKGLSGGTNHYFRIRAYRKNGSSYIYGDYTSKTTARTLPATVTGVNDSSRTKSSVKLTWTACKGASGYQVYRYNSSTKKWVRVGTTSTNSFTNSGLSRNTKYSYKVRAYQKVGGEVQYGAFSSTFSVRTRLL